MKISTKFWMALFLTIYLILSIYLVINGQGEPKSLIHISRATWFVMSALGSSVCLGWIVLERMPKFNKWINNLDK